LFIERLLESRWGRGDHVILLKPRGPQSERILWTVHRMISGLLRTVSWTEHITPFLVMKVINCYSYFSVHEWLCIKSDNNRYFNNWFFTLNLGWRKQHNVECLLYCLLYSTVSVCCTVCCTVQWVSVVLFVVLYSECLLYCLLYSTVSVCCTRY